MGVAGAFGLERKKFCRKWKRKAVVEAGEGKETGTHKLKSHKARNEKSQVEI